MTGLNPDQLYSIPRWETKGFVGPQPGACRLRRGT
jgi:hypothetical protein